MNNPFSLSFGSIPQITIDRGATSFDIISDFQQEKSSSKAYMITGVRGSGKTVFMTDICKKMRELDDWIILELSPEEDILQAIAYRLSKEKSFSQYILKANIDLSILNVEIQKKQNLSAPITLLVQELLELASKHNKKILIAIDEAINNKYIKEFAHSFQIFIRNELPIYLIMTGLYENIYEIQNEKTLTFLYRTPRIELQPLKTFKIAESYADVLGIDHDLAKELAKLTMGYAFAYQVLGYYYFENNDHNIEKLKLQFCNYLGEYVYEKIWSELSDKDKEVISAMTTFDSRIKVKDLRDYLNVDSSKFSHYRDRLKRKGIISVSDYGYISFVLPFFKEYISKAFLDE